MRKNLNFGSLGHPITDSKGNTINCKNGGVFNCTIDGIEKGKRARQANLLADSAFDKRTGNIYANNKFGAFGTFSSMPSYCKNTIEVADINEIKPGKAVIYCTLDDNVRSAYEIEIVKATPQNTRDDKGMVIHVTDSRLLEKPEESYKE